MFFVCTLVLAGCSALKYNVEQSAKTVSIDSSRDSAAYHSLVEQIVRDELQNRLDIQEWMERTTVTETLSAPDSAGVQHVTQRSTTTLSKRKQTSAESAQSHVEQSQQQVDSTRQQAAVSYLEKEEEKTVAASKKGFLPWYMYVVMLIGAVIVGFFAAWRKGWIRF